MAAEPDRLDALRIDRRTERDAPPRRRLWPWLLVAAVALGVGAWWSLRVRPVPVTVATVRQTAAGAATGAVLDASGYVVARRRATVSSKVTGKVTEVLVDEGMAVADGQVLARLDDSTARAELRLAEAEVASAGKALAETEARLVEARRNLERIRSLAGKGISSSAELDSAEAEADALAARLSLAREQVVVAERRAAVRRQALDDTVIRAPFSGVAISKDAQPGEMISPVSAGGGFTRTGICTLVDMQSLEIEVDVSESYINRVEPGQRVEAVLDAYPDWRIPARVITTVPAADRQKATVKVRVGFEDLDPRILPDMGVKVAFYAPAEEPAEGAETAAPAAPRALVPRAAVRREGDSEVVYAVAGGRAERRAVRLGPGGTAGRGDWIEALAGVAPGERVVVEGPVDLADGDPVTVRAAAE